MTSEMLIADKYLRGVQNRGERALPLKRVYRNMRHQSMFLKAYAKIYANAGATTVGTDPNDTIQGMSLARIDEIITQLREGTYRWKPSRRIYVPKSNGSTRPISISGWQNKLVQEVMRMILEAYYEPQFRDSSHGFRPNRGCHTALQTIKRRWNGVKWWVKGDIQGCFDTVNVLTELDRKLEERGHRFVRYADDCTIYVKSKRAGERVLENTQHYIENRMRLKVNQAKSGVDMATRRALLGFSFY